MKMIMNLRDEYCLSSPPHKQVSTNNQTKTPYAQVQTKRNPVVFPSKGESLTRIASYRVIALHGVASPQLAQLECASLPSVEGRQVASWFEYPGTPKVLDLS